MFSPSKALIAGAVVFALGGVLLIAQPFGQQGGSVPGAATDAAPQPPTEVSGHLICGPEVRAGTLDTEVVPLADGSMSIAHTAGYAWQPTATMNDPRLEGTYYISYDDDYYSYPGPASNRVGTGTWRIENEAGAWQGTYSNAILGDGTNTTASSILTGEGAYEGLTAFWEVQGDWDACTWDVRGLIFEGDVPAAPEPFIPE